MGFWNFFKSGNLKKETSVDKALRVDELTYTDIRVAELNQELSGKYLKGLERNRDGFERVNSIPNYNFTGCTINFDQIRFIKITGFRIINYQGGVRHWVNVKYSAVSSYGNKLIPEFGYTYRIDHLERILQEYKVISADEFIGAINGVRCNCKIGVKPDIQSGKCLNGVDEFRKIAIARGYEVSSHRYLHYAKKGEVSLMFHTRELVELAYGLKQRACLKCNTCVGDYPKLKAKINKLIDKNERLAERELLVAKICSEQGECCR